MDGNATTTNPPTRKSRNIIRLNASKHQERAGRRPVEADHDVECDRDDGQRDDDRQAG